MVEPEADHNDAHHEEKESTEGGVACAVQQSENEG